MSLRLRFGFGFAEASRCSSRPARAKATRRGVRSSGVVTKKSRSEQYSGWKNLVQSGYMAMRPVVPESLAKTVNKMSSSGETWQKDVM